MTDGSPSVGGDSAPEVLLVLVGVTAWRQDRERVSAYLKQHCTFDVRVPRVPYYFGLASAARWLTRYLAHEIPANCKAIHVLNYIGGGFVFRTAGPRLASVPVGRTIHVRSPIQEQVSRRLIERYTRPLMVLFAGRSVLDLAGGAVDTIPVPALGSGKGLIVELKASRLATRLGLSPNSVPASAWSHDRLLPGADDAIDLPVDHDEAYGSPLLLDQVLHFIAHGRFKPTGTTP
ncbi:MAG TPA: hypothetical protein P5337_07225 [Aestuariivirga sp.]|nr:hypothetical protein [Aestuariivirga sp.]